MKGFPPDIHESCQFANFNKEPTNNSIEKEKAMVPDKKPGKQTGIIGSGNQSGSDDVNGFILENASESKDEIKRRQRKKSDLEAGQIERQNGDIILTPFQTHFTKTKMEEKRKASEEEFKHLEEVEERISNERRSYAEGLTIHGANRIATGRPLNRIIWTILVVASFTIAILISIDHWEAFLSKESFSSTQVNTQNTIEVPAITVCNYNGINRERRHFEGGDPVYPRPKLSNISVLGDCGRNLTKCGYNKSTLLKVVTVKADYSKSKLRNDLVTFDNTTNCLTVSGHVQTFASDILSIQTVSKSTYMGIWNEIYVNPGSEAFFEASPMVYWASKGYYHINIVKKIITHLGKPYTKCIEGQGSYTQNKFKGNYTVTKCQKGCFWEKVFEKCGAIPQMYKKHMREPHRFENKTFVNDTYGQACLAKVENDPLIDTQCKEICQLPPCYEEDLKLFLDYHPSAHINYLQLAFTFQSFLVEIVEEVPAYTWQDLFANFGGCVGLMTGASILSLFELFIFLCLIVFDFFDIYTKVTTKFSCLKKK